MKVITITSCKGGVGKTTLTANIGSALVSEFKKNVLLIDGNLTGGSLGFHFGINYPTKTIADCVNGTKLHIDQTIYLHSNGSKLLLSPAHLDPRLDPSCLEHIVNSLNEDEYDYVLIDGAPGLGREGLSCMDVADEILLVSTPDIPCATNTMKTYEMGKKLRKKFIGIVLNQVDKKPAELTMAEIEQISDGLKVIATIPKSDDVPKSIALQEPVVTAKPNSTISHHFKKVAAYLANIHYEESGMWDKLKKVFGLTKEKRVSPEEVRKAKEFQKARMVDDVMKDVLDVEKLRTELAHEIKTELKESMKKEIVERLKQKLKERGLE